MTRKALHAPRTAIRFTPVPRRARFDGWTAEKQIHFIETLALTGSLRAAAASVNMSEQGAIWLRKLPGSESFNAAWDAAVAVGTEAIREKLVDHALNGIPEDVWHGGKKVGERRRFNHRSMMWVVEKGDKLRMEAEARARNYALSDEGRRAQAEELRERIAERMRRLDRRYNIVRENDDYDA